MPQDVHLQFPLIVIGHLQLELPLGQFAHLPFLVPDLGAHHALRLIEEAGVPVRMDRANQRLHSRFVVIDAATVVPCSHNWSAGSSFDFDDLTLVLASTPLATALRQRFEGLWATGR